MIRLPQPGPKFRIGYLLLLISLAIVIFFFVPPAENSLYPRFSSINIYDRRGKPLRTILSKDYKTSQWVKIKEMSPHIITATILEEDKRFFYHPGVDPLALLRAFYENIKYGRIVSGGSTITMQVVKVAMGLRRKSIWSKFIEILFSIKLELHLSKSEILEIYLNRMPYGNQTYGIEAAANFYFRKPARDLSLGEACILASIPKSPSLLNPYINPEACLRNKEKILDCLLQNRKIDTLSYLCARAESLNILPRPFNFDAPHFIDYILTEVERSPLRNSSNLYTSLDLYLQQDLEKLLATTLNSLQSYNVNQGAIIVMDVNTGEVLAMVGSRSYFDERGGQVNGCLALRQPGSAIKPFLYILGLESGFPASFVLPDTILEFRLDDGTFFAPRNYGDRYHGPTRLREALASSFNVPTVYLLNILGVQRFYNLLRDLNLCDPSQEPGFYGLALGLGAAEVNLLQLTNAYRAIFNQGLWQAPRILLTFDDSLLQKPKRVFSPDAAAIVTNILADNASRVKAFGEDNPLNLPFPCAAKTGTSKNFRDNWCVGFTSRYCVGVWVGNFDGSPMEGVSGISGAATIFRDIMLELHRNDPPRSFVMSPSLVNQKVCARSGLCPGSECSNIIDEFFIKGTQPDETCHLCVHQDQYRHQLEILSSTKGKPLEILSPADGSKFFLDPQISNSSQALIFRVKAREPIAAITFKLNNKIFVRMGPPFEYLWRPVPGKYHLEVSASGLVDSVDFWVY